MSDMVTHSGLVSISANWYWSVGLTAQGEVVAAGETAQGGGAWVPPGLDHGVTQVVAGSESAVALRSDGTVAMGGYGLSMVYAQQHDGNVVIRPEDGIAVPVPAAKGATVLATQGDNGLALVPSA